MNDVKIICTLGPSTKDSKTIQSLAKVGVDVFRVNMSHTDLSDLEDHINLAHKLNIVLGIDTEGAQIRTSLKNKKDLLIKKGEHIKIYNLLSMKNENELRLYPKTVFNSLRVGMKLRLDFNGAVIKIESIFDDFLECICENQGLISNNKGVDILNDEIELNDFTAKDIEAIKICKNNNIKNIFVSFCSSKEAVLKVKELYPEATITSKIENIIAINNLQEILEISQNILIDRGDLSREISLMDIPFAQRGIIKLAKENSTPCFVATNVLESLLTSDLPTRAELNDIVGTIEMGASGIVLAAETAIGLKPLLCVEIVKELIHKFRLYRNGLLFADKDRNEITDLGMKIWLNRSF